MKTRSKIIKILFVSIGVISGALGCSSMPGQSTSSKEIASTGPTVMNVRVEPGTIELNRELRPTRPAEILADVKDFRSKVNDVRLKFQDVPIQVPMEKVAGTTWRAELSPQQLQMLAVSGKTISYDAHIVAQNESGQVSQSPAPITVNIKAPDIAKSAG